MPDIDTIKQRLSPFEGVVEKRGGNTREAAVAVVLRPARLYSDTATEVLLIKRADKPSDPWSGQMAFPGGHLDPVDANLRAAAERETLEEVGLSLDGADYLGSLDETSAMARGRNIDLIIGPHVFVIDDDPVLAPNYEVAETVWAPLTPMLLGELHHWQTMDFTGTDTIYNGYLVQDQYFVWGLTYRMMKSFFAAIEPDWQPPPERD